MHAPHIVVLDNHDSFTFNLVQGLGELGADLSVFESDGISLAALSALAPDAVVISPGPGKPCDAGISGEVVLKLGAQIPMLGVCLGHQVICEALGARVEHASALFHGRTSRIAHDGRDLFWEMPDPFIAARYHSWVVDPGSLPATLQACAYSEQGELMAVRHRTWPLLGVQFHPESFLTEQGTRLLHNFLRFVAARRLRAYGSVHG